VQPACPLEVPLERIGRFPPDVFHGGEGRGEEGNEVGGLGEVRHAAI